MARVRVLLKDHVKGTKTHVVVPDDVPMNRLIPALVSRLGLPVEQNGEPIIYRMDNLDNHMRIADHQTLAEAEVLDNTELSLFPDVVAG